MSFLLLFAQRKTAAPTPQGTRAVLFGYGAGLLEAQGKQSMTIANGVDAPQINVTRALAGFVVQLRRERIPQDQFMYVQSSLLDWIGCCLAGTLDPAASSLDTVMQIMGGEQHAVVIARGRRTSVLNAVLVNGAAGAQLDFDDIHPGLIGHPSAVLAPTVLALGEWLGKSGREIGTAYAAGYEVMVRLGLAMEPNLYNRGWHATGVLGVFGACAAAGKVLGLSEAHLTSAFAIAASQAAGLRELFGTPSKCIHQGKAAMAGVLACLWAKEGVASSPDIFGGRNGLRVFSEPVQSGPALEGLGERFLLSETCYKRHASSGSLHAAMDAAIALRDLNGLSVPDIDKVEVVTHTLAADLARDNAAPKSAFAAKQSMHFSVALALKEGRGDLDLYTDTMVFDPIIRALQERITVTGDASMQYIEAMPAQVTVTTRSGRSLTLRVDAPKGRPSNPMQWDELAAKFRMLAGPILPVDRQQEVVRSLSDLDNLSVARLMSLLD